jgi:hypothetical protein
MVHHLQNLQNVAKTKFECPQARKQLAYAAQQRWLGLFGRTLVVRFQNSHPASAGAFANVGIEDH